MAAGGLLTRRALRRLTRAGDDGDPRAIEELWQAWLSEPDDELWATLSRWRDPQVMAEAVCGIAAVYGARSAANLRVLGEFCVRHGLLHGDELRWVLFCALTGQAAQVRAADPDGTRLAVAYRSADAPVRAALRVAITRTGDLDLVRVMGAGDLEGVARLSGDELSYLTSELTKRGDWPTLWRLAQDLPLARRRTMPCG